MKKSLDVEFIIIWNDHTWSTVTRRLSGKDADSEEDMTTWGKINIGQKDKNIRAIVVSHYVFL